RRRLQARSAWIVCGALFARVWFGAVDQYPDRTTCAGWGVARRVLPVYEASYPFTTSSAGRSFCLEYSHGLCRPERHPEPGTMAGLSGGGFMDGGVRHLLCHG